jgi:hypothetical protein
MITSLQRFPCQPGERACSLPAFGPLSSAGSILSIAIS